MRKLDIAGQVFGKLTAISLSHMQGGRAHWLCRCECGVERTVGVAWLRSGNTTSCGSCSKLGNTRALKHGGSPRGPRSPLYRTWKSIKKRCYDPKHDSFEHYGGRGIGMLDRWRNDYALFREEIVKEIGDRPEGMTLDRIDNDRGYEPGNVRWATPLQQRHNRRS